MSFSAEGRALLFSVEVHHLLSQYSTHGGQTLRFQWYLRLSEGHNQIGPSDSSAGNAGSAGEGREKRREELRRRDASRAEVGMQGPGSLSYEIRAVSVGPRGGTGGDVLCSAGPVLPPCAGYIIPHAWMRCSGLAPHSVIPLKGRIEVWVLSRGGGVVRSIEANQLQVTNITHTATPYRGLSKDFRFRYYLASNSDVTDQSFNEGRPETAAAAAAVPVGGEEVHQIGGDLSGWTNNLNQACSLLTATQGAFGANSTSLAIQIPKGFSAARRIVCSDAGELSGRKHTLYFHAKLSFYGTSRYSRGGDEQSGKEKDKSSKTSEVRGNQGYEWRVLLARGRGCGAEGRGRAETVTEGSCPYQQSDLTAQNGPWVWSGICAELGPLHSGDEVLLVTRVVLSSPGGLKDQDMASSCSVEVSNCEIVSTLAGQNEGSGSGGEFGEGRWDRERDRVKTGSASPSGGAMLGTIPRIPHTAHFALFNDQSLALPIC